MRDVVYVQSQIYAKNLKTPEDAILVPMQVAFPGVTRKQQQKYDTVCR